MSMPTRYHKATTLLSFALAYGLLLSCASAPKTVRTTRETASQWNAVVDEHIPDAQRAGKVKQLGLQLIELQDPLSSDIAVLHTKAAAVNANDGSADPVHTGQIAITVPVPVLGRSIGLHARGCSHYSWSGMHLFPAMFAAVC